jgi:hypothetical protein
MVYLTIYLGRLPNYLEKMKEISKTILDSKDKKNIIC